MKYPWLAEDGRNLTRASHRTVNRLFLKLYGALEKEILKGTWKGK